MSLREAAWLAHQRRRWMLPDPSRWLQPDQRKWIRPEAAWQPSPGLHERKYSPDQPRVPAGNSEGGQWTDAGGDGGRGIANGRRLSAEGRTDRLGLTSDEAADESEQTHLAGSVIRVCIVIGRSLGTDQWGNKTFKVIYECAGDRTFTVSGVGHDFPGIVPDPFPPPR